MLLLAVAMRSPFTLLITAAGEGSRFKKAGLHVPKPMILVEGRTLLEHTLDSFSIQEQDTLLISYRREHQLCKQLQKTLQQRLPGITLQWLEFDHLPPGQLATASASINNWLQSSEAPLDKSQPLLIHNCDTGFQWNNECLPNNSDASMPVFEAPGNHWSFGKPDKNDPNRAIAIAEKKRISSLASIGLYGFESIEQFSQQAKIHLRKAKTFNGEHYISPLLQSMVEQNLYISLPRVEGIKLYGTPSELCTTFNISKEVLLRDNS